MATWRSRSGLYEEYQGSSAVIRVLRPPTALMAAGPWRQNAQQMRLKSAEKHFREALKFDSSLVEARMRLGRVLQQRGSMQDARTELEAVFGQQDAPPAIRYLASMFLVDVLEAQGNPAASLARARDLAARYPECQSAHLTLSRAYEARGQRVAALVRAGAAVERGEGAHVRRSVVELLPGSNLAHVRVDHQACANASGARNDRAPPVRHVVAMSATSAMSAKFAMVLAVATAAVCLAAQPPAQPQSPAQSSVQPSSRRATACSSRRSRRAPRACASTCW